MSSSAVAIVTSASARRGIVYDAPRRVRRITVEQLVAAVVLGIAVSMPYIFQSAGTLGSVGTWLEAATDRPIPSSPQVACCWPGPR